MIKSCETCKYHGIITPYMDKSYQCFTCKNFNNYEEKENIMGPKNYIDYFKSIGLTTNHSAISTDRIRIPRIKKVIFNEPATIVFWGDDTKTVVKTQNGEAYDPEKGLAMAIAKKALGNKGNYFNEIKKWIKDQDPKVGILNI